MANWTTDGAIRLEHCRSATFLMSVHAANLTGVLSSDNCSGAAGTLVSQGPVTLRLSAKLMGFFRYASRFHVLGWHLANTKEMPSSTRPVRRKSGLSDTIFSLLLLQMTAMAVLWGCTGNCTIIILYILFHS